jgi:hypothetical protein
MLEPILKMLFDCEAHSLSNLSGMPAMGTENISTLSPCVWCRVWHTVSELVNAV